MAKYTGRDLTIKTLTGSTYTVIADVTSKSVEFNNSGIDITTDDDGGWQNFLAEPGLRAVNLSVSGVADDAAEELLTAISLGTSSVALLACQVEFNASGSTLTGNFHLEGLTHTGEKDGATLFEATLRSAGTITKA